MPVFFAKWLDGSFSVVAAINEKAAYSQLAEINEYGPPVEIWKMRTCLLDFVLGNSGEFRLSEIGEETAAEILERGYPRLRRALAKERFPQHYIADSPEREYKLEAEIAEKVRKAVKAEHLRLLTPSARRKKLADAASIDRKS